MVKKILSKQNFPKFINGLIGDNDVYAPIQKNEVLSYEKISDANEIASEYLNSNIPPKSIFFPQKDVLFTYEKKDEDVILEDAFQKGKPKIVFGIRSCDAYSFKLLDNFFDFGKFKDKNYLDRRKDSIIMGLGCNTPRKTCFCTSVGGNPFQKENTDVYFTDLEDKYLVEGITEAGSNLINKNSLFQDAPQGDIDKVEALSKKIAGEMKVVTDIKEVTKKLDDLYEDPMWEDLSKKCIRCGSCSFLCPTCHCFDVIDENIDKRHGRRVRIWDTCQFPLFTLHGSGHNPRPDKKMRARQRLYHKFNYYDKMYDLCGCVGCGRCIQSCPSNADIRETFEIICAGGMKTD